MSMTHNSLARALVTVNRDSAIALRDALDDAIEETEPVPEWTGCQSRYPIYPTYQCQRRPGHEGPHYVGAHGSGDEWEDLT
jgi:hypothetical protein